MLSESKCRQILRFVNSIVSLHVHVIDLSDSYYTATFSIADKFFCNVLLWTGRINYFDKVEFRLNKLMYPDGHSLTNFKQISEPTEDKSTPVVINKYMINNVFLSINLLFNFHLLTILISYTIYIIQSILRILQQKYCRYWKI